MLGRWCTQAVLWLVGWYQRWLSPLLPPMCRYEPTCSAYMAQAITRRGFWRGLLKGLWRLCRCHPFARGGWDPVDPSDRPVYLDTDNRQREIHG